MDDEELGPDRVAERDPARLTGWFQASPAELAGLAVLLLGAIVATALVLLDVGRRPAEGPPDAATIGVPAHPDHLDEHPPGSAGPGQPGAGTPSAEPPAEVTVHVSGAVASPGVVTLPGGARVADALGAAGGAVADAETERLNLARPLTDGEQIHVPRAGEPLPEPVEVPGGGGVDAQGRVDLNRATQDELETLPGIGPAKAAAIITHRETEGPFQVPGDLRAVPGIGERTFQQLADLVTVG